MKTILAVAFILCCGKAVSQKDYTIRYAYETGVSFNADGSTKSQRKMSMTLHVYGDTLGLSRLWINEVKKSNSINLGSKEVHHGILYYYKNDSSLEISTAFNKVFFVINEPSKKWQTIEEDTIKILGYTCKKAIMDNEIYAWFTPEINVRSPFFGFQSLPGVILQLIDYKHQIWITAEQIEHQAPTLIFPKKFEIVTSQVYQQFLEKRRRRMGF